MSLCFSAFNPISRCFEPPAVPLSIGAFFNPSLNRWGQGSEAIHILSAYPLHMAFDSKAPFHPISCRMAYFSENNGVGQKIAGESRSQTLRVPWSKQAAGFAVQIVSRLPPWQKQSRVFPWPGLPTAMRPKASASPEVVVENHYIGSKIGRRHIFCNIRPSVPGCQVRVAESAQRSSAA